MVDHSSALNHGGLFRSGGFQPPSSATAASRRHAALQCALLVAFFACGCRGVGKYLDFTTGADPVKPQVVKAFWLKQVQFAPDSNHKGAPTPLLGGNAYFYPADKVVESDGRPTVQTSQSMSVDGELIVEVYDCTSRGESKEPKPLARTAYPREVLAAAKKHDPLLGLGYSIAVPLGEYDRDVTKVQFRVIFKPADGGPELTAIETVPLEHGKTQPNPIQPTSKQIVVTKP